MEPRLKFANDVTVKDGVITAILSTEAVDRDGDVVRLDGWDLGNFNKAPRLMSCHDYSSLTKQIGEWRNVRVDPQLKALIGEPHYYTGMGNPEADWAYELAKLGQATYSVGFMPFDSEPRKGHGGSVFTRQELLECSHVPIPSNQEALQLMAKALLSRERKERRQGGIVRKWDSNYLGDADYAPLECRCIVPGCDDASQTSVNVCSEHLKVLMNAPAEPPGGEADEEAEALMRAFTKRLRVKAGRQISAANMGKLHSAMQSLKDVHDANCTADDCPLDDDGDEEPPEERDKAHKAASEGDGSAGGVTVSDSGTHGAFDGKHTHDHAAPDGGMHDHSHTHDGDGDHGHSHGKALLAALDAAIDKSHSDLPDSAFACIDPGGTKEDGKTRPLSLRHYPHHTESGGVDKGLLRSALSRIADPANEQCGKAHLEAHAKDLGIGEDNSDDKKHFDLSVFEDAMTKALEGVQW